MKVCKEPVLSIIKNARRGNMSLTNFDKERCSIGDEIVDYKIIKNNSVSNTVKLTTKIGTKKSKSDIFSDFLKDLGKNPEIFMKISTNYGDNTDKNTTFLVENLIYAITSVLIKTKISPNFVRYIYDFTCDDSFKHLPKNIQKELMVILSNVDFKERWMYEEVKNGRNISLSFLMTEKIKGERLSEYKYKTAGELKQIIFQVLYTLHQLNLLGIRHNDIHSGNVMIETMKEPTYYRVGGKTFKTQGVRAKIYDYDHSTFVDKELSEKYINTDVVEEIYGFCDSFGECPNPNTKFDLLVFLNSWEWIGEWKDFLKPLKIKPVYLNAHSKKYQGFPGRLCTMKKVGNRYKCFSEEPSDKDVPSILSMLDSSFFKELRTDDLSGISENKIKNMEVYTSLDEKI